MLSAKPARSELGNLNEFAGQTFVIRLHISSMDHQGRQAHAARALAPTSVERQAVDGDAVAGRSDTGLVLAQRPAVLAPAPSEPRDLVLVAEAVRMLAEARTIPDVKRVADLALLARQFAKKAHLGLAAQNAAATIYIEAQAKAGDLLWQMAARGERATAGANQWSLHAATTTLAELDVERTEAHRWGQVCAVPAELRAAYVAEAVGRREEVSRAGLLSYAARRRTADPALDVAPTIPAEPWVQTGDLLVLGAHRLLVADATDPANLARLMAGETATLFVTDPPYLVDYTGGNHSLRPAAPPDHHLAEAPRGPRALPLHVGARALHVWVAPGPRAGPATARGGHHGLGGGPARRVRRDPSDPEARGAVPPPDRVPHRARGHRARPLCRQRHRHHRGGAHRPPCVLPGDLADLRAERRRALGAPRWQDGEAGVNGVPGEGDGRPARHRSVADPTAVEFTCHSRRPTRRTQLANQPDGERTCGRDREATGSDARRAEPLDRFEAAVVFAMREAKRLQREREAPSGTPDEEDRSP